MGDLFNNESVQSYLFSTEDFNCSARLEPIADVARSLSEFANYHLEVSYNYMMLASQFNAHPKERPSFSALFQYLSDLAWASAVDVMKYIAKRGGHMKISHQNQLVDGMNDLNELEAMATVLDTMKGLFEKAREIHKRCSDHRQPRSYDPHVAHYIQEEYLDDLVASIGKFSGIVNGLKNLYVGSNDISMDNHIFDQYLLKY